MPRRQRLAAAAFPVGRIAAGKHDHVIVPHQRPPSLQVTQNVRAAPGREGEVARRCRAEQRVDLGLVKVGVAVDVEHAVPSAPPERQHRPEQQRAIASQHDRELPVAKQRFHLISQRDRIVAQRLRVHHLGSRIRHAAISAGRNAARPASMETVGQASFEQDTRRAFHTEMLRNVPER